MYLNYARKRCDIVLRPLRKVIRNLTPDYKFHAIFKSLKVGWYITPKLKPSAPVFSKSHAVYIFKCDCDTSTYIGQTSRSTLTRIMEHKPHYQRQPEDPNAIPKSDSHIKDHIIKYVDGEVISKC